MRGLGFNGASEKSFKLIPQFMGDSVSQSHLFHSIYIRLVKLHDSSDSVFFNLPRFEAVQLASLYFPREHL